MLGSGSFWVFFWLVGLIWFDLSFLFVGFCLHVWVFVGFLCLSFSCFVLCVFVLFVYVCVVFLICLFVFVFMCAYSVIGPPLKCVF